jgi:hypothetical protein
MAILDEQKICLTVMKKEDLNNLYFSLGLTIRNTFKLYEPESKLLASCGIAHPDDASAVIISELWQALHF